MRRSAGDEPWPMRLGCTVTSQPQHPNSNTGFRRILRHLTDFSHTRRSKPTTLAAQPEDTKSKPTTQMADAKETNGTSEQVKKTRFSKPPRCQFGACNESARYGDAYAKTIVYCKTHALAWHTHNYLRARNCVAAGCMRVPEFGCPKVREVLLCESHAVKPTKPVRKFPGARKQRPLFCSHPGCVEWPMLYKHRQTMKLDQFCSTHAPSDYRLYFHM